MDMSRRLGLAPAGRMKRLFTALLWLRSGGYDIGTPRRSIESSRNTRRSANCNRGGCGGRGSRQNQASASHPKPACAWKSRVKKVLHKAHAVILSLRRIPEFFTSQTPVRMTSELVQRAARPHTVVRFPRNTSIHDRILSRSAQSAAGDQHTRFSF